MSNKKEEKKEIKKSSVILEKNQKYSIDEALELCQKLSKTKFDASVEVHFRLGIDPKKGDQQIRSAISLPHGTGKDIKVAAFTDKEKEAKEAGADLVGSEELIAKIKKTEKTDFDVAVAEPAMMKNLGKIAKILGTRGLMPSPKNETVTDKIVETIKELKRGKISFKNDNTSNVHVIIGKISFKKDALLDNYRTMLDAIKKAKPAGAKGIYIKNISINSTMGSGIKVVID
ncbi:50S ribosomal protein L1 [bacterium]|nr:50S ribosomal protein L1 [bacterium]